MKRNLPLWLAWLLTILLWIVLSPLYLAVWLWSLITGRKMFLGK